jgi:glycosyltransferase involved in cell wall biosynthesis
MTPLTVAWISDFPVEWIDGVPEFVASLPREHPSTWQTTLLGEFEKRPDLRLHILVLRKGIPKSISFERNGVMFHVLKYRGGIRTASFYWADTFLIRRALAKIKPDLVHAWGNERGAGLVASRLPWPFLVTIQGLFTWYREQSSLSAVHKVSVWAERFSLARARHATTESRFAVAWLKERFPRLTVHQVEHAPNPVFAAVCRRPALKPIRLLTNGTIGSRKGTDLFLRALADLPADIPFEAVVIGPPNPEFIEPIKASLPSSVWERITFKSNLVPAQVADELAQATLFVLPTRADTSPNAVKEAVVAGTPVVASAVGGVPDYVAAGQNGILFDADDQAACSAALREACLHPLFGIGQVSPESLQKSREYLSVQRMGRLFHEAYLAATTNR